MRSEDKLRKCTSCHRADRTSFSKCRFCGTEYNAKNGEATRRLELIVSLCAFVILIGAVYAIYTAANGFRANQVTPGANQVRRSNGSSKPVPSTLTKTRKLAAN